MHTFRITDEQVEVRSGILFRTNRKGRLDRIQGINIVRPFFARLFGAARLEITVAGGDGNVQLAYLSGVRADELRRDILLLASGTAAGEGGDGGGTPGARGRRASSSSGSTSSSRPSSTPGLAEPASVVTMHPGSAHRLDGAERRARCSSSSLFVGGIVAAVAHAASSTSSSAPCPSSSASARTWSTASSSR